tara:strand:+ start:10999 stop:11211 length:213 start_codon:yes stop_codon:yes gene_type:complete
MIITVVSLAIGFFLAIAVLTIYVKFKETDIQIKSGQCKMCNKKNTILRGFTPLMIEHYCPDCKTTFFTTP